MSAPADSARTAAAQDDATFWAALPTGHRVALFATPFVIVGALGQWARGTFATFALSSGLRAQETTVYGYEREGWLIAVPALVAFLALLLVKDRQKRSGRALAWLSFAALVALGEVITGGLLFDFRQWAEVQMLWGPPLALAAAVVAAGGALWGSRDARGPDAT